MTHDPLPQFRIKFKLFLIFIAYTNSFLGYDAMALAVAKPHLRAELENDLKA